ncbi:hypothetical protein [Myceligenerans indicum]|uniref:Uncharacterized protein n=1 Tax=Myceligenerans indicum TaxID=2593663 RepID=A0ABS1LHZ6_9MICO|nr:hypothetical protein [Myceligenerans indicum]MBL0885769.1 hypothetical protein [Myceligenerans indicum]
MSAPTQSRRMFDPWARVPHLTHLRDAAVSGDIAGLSAALDSLEGDELSFAIHVLADVDGLEARLTSYLAAGNEPPVLVALLAAHHLVEGGRIRTAARADHVSAAQFEGFHARLRRAEGLLLELCARRGEFLPAWEIRVTVARGLELGASEGRRRYDRVRALDPWYYPAQAAFLQQVCPKWGGSWQAAHAFVAECRDGAPPGTLSPAVGVDLHLEQWVAAGGGRSGMHYLRQPAVLEDLRTTAMATVWHPDHVPGPSTATVHTGLAQAFALAGMPALAAPHFRALGDAPAEGSWGYTGDAAGEYQKYRAVALGTEGGR